MSSVMRHTGAQPSSLRPMVGDTKTSMVRADHIGWLLCDGRELSQTEYRALFAVLGTEFGTAAAGKFKLPDSRGRVMGLINQDNENTTARTDLSGWTDGDVSGEQTHTLTIGEMPRHTHGPTPAVGDADGTGVTGLTTLTEAPVTVMTNINVAKEQTTASSGLSTSYVTDVTPLFTTSTVTPNPHNHTIGSTGDSQPHNNIQPTLFLGNLFIYSGRVVHNVTQADGISTPTSNRSYYPPTQEKRIY